MTWAVTLEKNGHIIQRGNVPYLGATIQRALAYPSGIYIEHYRLVEATDSAARAVFEKLTRDRQLEPNPRNPARLPL